MLLACSVNTAIHTLGFHLLCVALRILCELGLRPMIRCEPSQFFSTLWVCLRSVTGGVESCSFFGPCSDHDTPDALRNFPNVSLQLWSRLLWLAALRAFYFSADNCPMRFGTQVGHALSKKHEVFLKRHLNLRCVIPCKRQSEHFFSILFVG